MFENPVLKEVHFSYGTVFNDTSFNENTLLKYRDNVNKYMYIFCWNGGLLTNQWELLLIKKKARLQVNTEFYW